MLRHGIAENVQCQSVAEKTQNVGTTLRPKHYDSTTYKTTQHPFPIFRPAPKSRQQAFASSLGPNLQEPHPRDLGLQGVGESGPPCWVAELSLGLRAYDDLLS